MFFVAILCGALFLVTAYWHRSLWQLILPLSIGFLFFAIHHKERKQVRSSQELCLQFSQAHMQVHCPAAEVISTKTTRTGFSAIIKTCSDQTTLHATEHHFPKGSRFILYTKQSLAEGAIIQFRGRLSARESYRNFGEFDWAGYHRKNGIIGTLQADNPSQIATVMWRHELAKLKNRIRSSIISRITYGIDPDSQATWVLPALVLGVDPAGDLLHAFRDAGVMHLFVVSGLHVGLVIAIVWILLYFSPLSSLRILSISLIITWLYVFITGAEPPAVRAALIISIFSFGIIWRQRVNIWNSAIAALIIILAFDRYALLDIGVLLSFGVVFALIFMVQSIVNFSSQWAIPDSFLPRELWSELQETRLRFARWSLGILTVAIVSWITSSLITAFSFGRIYLFGFIASLLLFPVAFSMMVISALSLIIGIIYQPATIPLNQTNATLAEHAAGFATWIEKHPHSVLKVNSYGYRNAVTVFNLPRGAAAIYLDVEDGILIDCGSEWMARSIIAPCLEHSGMTVGRIFLSHNDSAHSTGQTEFPEAKIIPSFEGKNTSYDFGEVRIQTYSFQSTESTSADDNIALFRIITPTQTIGYIADAGAKTLHQLTAEQHDFSCDTLIVGNHSKGESDTEGFVQYSGAKKVILGRDYYYTERLHIPGTTTLDQRYEGAVQLHF